MISIMKNRDRMKLNKVWPKNPLYSYYFDVKIPGDNEKYATIDANRTIQNLVSNWFAIVCLCIRRPMPHMAAKAMILLEFVLFSVFFGCFLLVRCVFDTNHDDRTGRTVEERHIAHTITYTYITLRHILRTL